MSIYACYFFSLAKEVSTESRRNVQDVHFGAEAMTGSSSAHQFNQQVMTSQSERTHAHGIPSPHAGVATGDVNNTHACVYARICTHVGQIACSLRISESRKPRKSWVMLVNVRPPCCRSSYGILIYANRGLTKEYPSLTGQEIY